jgi:hypothetical protein
MRAGQAAAGLNFLFLFDRVLDMRFFKSSKTDICDS